MVDMRQDADVSDVIGIGLQGYEAGRGYGGHLD